MDSYLLYQVLKKELNKRNTIEIRANGNSMIPLITEGDKIVIEEFDSYSLGDVIVFYSKVDNALLVHRIVRKDNIIICKGDNSFRLEAVDKCYILGKVINIRRIDDSLVVQSYLVGRSFVVNNYDMEKTKQSKLYKEYVAQLTNLSSK